MFVNYVARPVRAAGFNVACARFLLGSYLVWKTLSYDWAALAAWPVYPLFHPEYALLAPAVVRQFAWLEQWVLVAALAAFAVGYRIALSGVVSAALLAHLGATLFMLNPSWLS